MAKGGGVFKIYEEPELPNEGGVCKIYYEQETPNEKACCSFLRDRIRQMREHV